MFIYYLSRGKKKLKYPQVTLHSIYEDFVFPFLLAPFCHFHSLLMNFFRGNVQSTELLGLSMLIQCLHLVSLGCFQEKIGRWFSQVHVPCENKVVVRGKPLPISFSSRPFLTRSQPTVCLFAVFALHSVPCAYSECQQPSGEQRRWALSVHWARRTPPPARIRRPAPRPSFSVRKTVRRAGQYQTWAHRQTLTTGRPPQRREDTGRL